MRKYISGFVLGALISITAVTFAQAPAPAAKATAQAPEKKEAYTELESLMVQYVQLNDRFASCQQALGQKNVLDLGADVKNRIEAAHPGFTVDWKTGALIPKK